MARAAEPDLFQLYWSEEVLAEARRNLVASDQVRQEHAERLFSIMTDVFPELAWAHQNFHGARRYRRSKARGELGWQCRAGVPAVGA